MIEVATLLLLLSLCVVRADSRILKYERKAGINEPPVPRDRLLKGRFKFARPNLDAIRRAFEIGHSISEVFYAGDGRYAVPGEYPTEIRHTSNRVLGYIPAYRTLGDPIYRQRAVEGLDYLLRLQEKSPDGDFPWYYRSYRGVRNRDDGLFEAGMAGRAFVEGYRLTGDKRYLDASVRVAEWEIGCPISRNNNYNMLAVWHLAAHHEVAPDPRFIDSAIEKTRLGGMPEQLPSGGWPGHNSWMWYHGIIARGMAELLRVLPDDHVFRPDLTASLTAALNRAIREQCASGEVPPNPRLKTRSHTCAFILHALLVARQSFGAALDNCINGIVDYRLRKLPDELGVRALAEAWSSYVRRREAARDAATDEVVWRADLDRVVRDAEWGRMAVGVFNCWYPGNDFDPAHQQWSSITSERTGRGAQRITSTGVRLFGGMGWRVPRNVLLPGRRYRFTAWTRCDGAPGKTHLVLCSAYSGRERPNWDPFSECEFTRENPTCDNYSPVTVCFTANGETTYVYVWMMGAELSSDESVSLTVDEAVVSDAGLPFPRWDPSLDAFEGDPYMILLPTGVYLETMSASKAVMEPVDGFTASMSLGESPWGP